MAKTPHSECGCFFDPTMNRVFFCNVHAAAFDLLDVCHDARNFMHGTSRFGLKETYVRLDQAIAKAQNRSTPVIVSPKTHDAGAL